MVIAVDTRFFIQDELVGYKVFLKELLIKLACQYPDHRFIFLFDRPLSSSYNFPTNVEIEIVGKTIDSYLKLRRWFDFKLPKVLKKRQADVFISSESVSFRISIPQILVIGSSINNSNTSILHAFFVHKYFSKAQAVVALSQVVEDAIVSKYKVPAKNIHAISAAANESFRPIRWEEREQIKEKYAQGSEYFLFTGGVDPDKNLLNLLKAFSLFKRRQHTSMKLIVTGRLQPDNNGTVEKLKTYKFKNDVIVLGFISGEEFSKVMAAAYALVYPSTSESIGLPIVEAFKSEVAVITSNNKGSEEIAKGAALFADPNNPDDLAERLKIIFKDEQLRGELIEQGKKLSQKFTIENSVTQLWNAIELAISK